MRDSETCARVGAALGVQLNIIIEDFEAQKKYHIFDSILKDDINWSRLAYNLTLDCVEGGFKEDFSRDMEDFYREPTQRKAQEAMNLLRYPV